MSAEGLERLSRTLDGLTLDREIGEDAEVLGLLAQLEHTNLRDFSGIGQSVKASRAAVRYLAALWPDATVRELTDRIYTLLNNRHLLPEDVRDVLNGVSLGTRDLSPQDVKLLVDGRRLNDASKRTREVPIQVIQLIGRCLREGLTFRETARVARCSFDTVAAVDRLLGLRQAYLDKRFDRAVDAVRDGVSNRKFATLEGMSRSAAQRLMQQARTVLVEIGELND
jgi:hypothetical protein